MPATLQRNAYAIPVYIVGPDGEPVNLAGILQAGSSSSSPDTLDTDGNPVPLNKAHTFTYDTSGNLQTDTVTDGASSWTRTFTYTNGNQTADSGWVKNA